MKKELLTTLVTLALGSGFVLPAQAVEHETISAGGKDMFSLHVVQPEDAPEGATGTEYIGGSSTYDLTKAGFYSGVKDAVQYWADVLAAGSSNTKPVDVIINTYNENNAEAIGVHAFDDDKRGNKLSDGPTRILQDDLDCDAIAPYVAKKYDDLTGKEYAFALVTVGKNLGVNEDDGNYGFATSAPSQLNPIDGSVNLTGVVMHELGHALGYCNDMETVKVDGYEYSKFAETDANSFNAHLYDQNLKQAKAGMVVATYSDIDKLLAAGVVKSKDDVFVVDIDGTKDMQEDAVVSGQAFFMGDNVKRVLDGKTFFGISGLPMNVWEAGDIDGADPDGSLRYKYDLELGHLEVPRLLMTHDDYRNFTTFSELELAVMQDLGYKIDARNYFGRSIYNDGQTIVNEDGYSARNSDGTAYTGSASTTTYGIGLHVYGSRNDVTQKGAISTVGTGAAGIRVDGVADKLTVAQGTQVRADGRNGVGLLVAYGKDHVVNVQGVVTAMGRGGNALQLDFGGNSLGPLDYRGSYIYYSVNIDEHDGKIKSAKNASLFEDDGSYAYDKSMTEAGDLVGKLATVNISGTVAGNENAIYIGHSAFVDAININEGAVIQGKIRSDWKNFDETIYNAKYDDGDDSDDDDEEDGSGEGSGDSSGDGSSDGGEGSGDGSTDSGEGSGDSSDDDEQDYRESVRIQVSKDNSYDYDAYVPGLVTQLNFATNMYYNDDIIGKDNMQLNVKDGTLRYDGTATVIGVNVAGGATLLGGTYKLSEQKSDEFDTSTTGTLVNRGTIGALTPQDIATQLQIDGRLVSDGSLQFTANGSKTGSIEVTGAADISGSTVTVDAGGKYLPGAYSFVTAKDGLTADNVSHDAYSRGLLTSSLDADNAGVINFTATNNLGAAEQGAFESIVSAYENADADSRDAYAEMFSLDAQNVRRANHALAEQKLLTLPQRSTMMQRYAGGRLQSLWNPLIKHSEVDWWLRSLKDWHYYDGLHGKSDSVAAGMDMNTGSESRSGVYGMYNHTRLGSALQQDWRVGAYTGKQHGAVRQYAYLDAGSVGTHYTRGVRGTGYAYDAKYTGRIAELGAEYQYDLLHGDEGGLRFAPYVSLEASRYLQKGYGERGSVLGFDVAGTNNNYAAGELGAELGRELDSGSYSLRLGYKHVLCGAQGLLRYNYQGAYTAALSDNTTMDKDYLHLTLGGALKLRGNLSISGEAGWLQGAHDRDLMADVKLNWSF